MDQAEFDKFAEEYREVHRQNISLFQEGPDYFAEYKIKDTAKLASASLPNKNLKVLDFGAGVGNSIPFFKKHMPGATLTCLDVSQASLEIAEQRFGDAAQYRHFDGQGAPAGDAQFDLVFSACVFHHIPHAEHEHLLAELIRVLRPGGLLVIFEHNPYNPLTVHAVNTCPFDENAELIKARAMVSRIRKTGFGEVKKRYRIFFPGFLRALRPLEKYLTWLPLGGQYYVAARKCSAAVEE